MVADVGLGLDGGVGSGRGGRPRWWAPVLVSLVVAVVATLLALAVNVASSSGRWPLGLHVIQDEPFWSVLGLTVLAAAAGLGRLWWQQRLELADDTDIASASGLRELVIHGPVTIHTQQAPPAAQQGVVSNLPSRNPVFTGRGFVFERLDSALGGGPVAVVAVAGLGGLGKTQVALEWAHRGLEGGRYRIAWWVRAETSVTLAEDLAGLAPGLGMAVVADQAQVVAGVRSALASMDKWLVVFDNAPDADSVRAWLPAGAGDVVVTSRDQRWGGVANALPIEVFDRDESVAFLQRRTGQAGALLSELAAVLGDLPLALAQAASYMEAHGGLSVKAYLDLFRDRVGAGRLLTSGLPGYPDSVATTWLIHFQDLELRASAGLVLLRLVAFADPDDLNVTLLLSRPDLLGHELTRRLAQACTDRTGVEETVGALVGSGLVSRVDDDRIRVHRLVGVVTRHQLAADGAEQAWAGQVMKLLAGLMPDTPREFANWAVCGELAAHILAAAEFAPPVDHTAVALHRLGQYLMPRGEYAAALDVTERALAIAEAVYGADHPEVVVTLTDFGNVQWVLGELEAARATLLRALAIDEAAHGADHPGVVRALSILGAVQQDLGELEAARVTYLRALAINEAAYGADHPEVAYTLGNLGTLQDVLGELEAARTTQLRTLAINEEMYGPDHPQVAHTLNNLGVVQQELGELEAARATHVRALTIKEAVFGPDHPQVAISLDSLGDVQRGFGDFEAAQVSYMRALTIMEAKYPLDHPFVANTLNNLGVVQKALGELEAARASWERALTIRQARLGDSHPATRTTANNLLSLPPD